MCISERRVLIMIKIKDENIIYGVLIFFNLPECDGRFQDLKSGKIRNFYIYI